ncbi:MAG: energy-coupling factor ABC transporter permease [Actinomycetota bacterium]
MHIPDGFINAGVSAAAGVVSAGGIGYSLHRAKETLSEKLAPMAGLVAAFIFAVQMLTFPVAAGTSGHLLGGCLAAILVGPWAGAVAVAVVLLVQALLFADGGLTALGLNVLNMSLIAGWGGFALFVFIRRVLPATRASAVAASGIAALLSVVLASLGFVIEYAVGGNGGASVATVFAAMIGTHCLIGIGEGIITALTVGVVLGVRPDLVYGAQDLVPTLEVRDGSLVAGRS